MIDAVVAMMIQCGSFYSEPTTRGAKTAACIAANDFNTGRITQGLINYISMSAQLDWTTMNAYGWEVIAREEARLKTIKISE